MRTLVLLVVLAVSLSGCAEKPRFEWQEKEEAKDPELDREDLTLRPVAKGYDRPVLVLPVPHSDRTLIVQQAGRVWALDRDGPTGTPFLDLGDRVGTCHFEQGLLGLAFSPDHANDGRLYVTYTDKPCNMTATGEDRKGDLRLSRFTMEPGSAHVDNATEEVLLTVPQPYRNHNGGHLLFGPDGYLYLGIGDGGLHGDPQRNGQNKNTLLATIVRLDVSGSTGFTVPPDNPFVGEKQAKPEIFIYGLRNPWRFTFDAATGDLWIADVGQYEIEEIDRLTPEEQAGANLGWSLYEGRERFNDGPVSGSFVFPVHEYRHEGVHCSVTGGPLLRNTTLPGLEGAYLFSDFCSGMLWALHPEDGMRVETIGKTGLQVTSFGTDADGNVLLLHWDGDVRVLASRSG